MTSVTYYGWVSSIPVTKKKSFFYIYIYSILIFPLFDKVDIRSWSAKTVPFSCLISLLPFPILSLLLSYKENKKSYIYILYIYDYYYMDHSRDKTIILFIRLIFPLSVTIKKKQLQLFVRVSVCVSVNSVKPKLCTVLSPNISTALYN